MEKHYTPENITELQSNEVFVFGSNKNGWHNGGAAFYAFKKFGAKYGEGEGLFGSSYAFPTLDKDFQKVSTFEMKKSFLKLFQCAEKNKDKKFLLTKVGCGIAEWTEDEVKDILWKATDEYGIFPDNIVIPKEFDR